MHQRFKSDALQRLIQMPAVITPNANLAKNYPGTYSHQTLIARGRYFLNMDLPFVDAALSRKLGVLNKQKIRGKSYASFRL